MKESGEWGEEEGTNDKSGWGWTSVRPQEGNTLGWRKGWDAEKGLRCGLGAGSEKVTDRESHRRGGKGQAG